MELPARFGELEVQALPYIIVHLADSKEDSNGRLFLKTGSDIAKLARDYFGIAHAEAIRFHQEHPPFELFDHQELDEPVRAQLLAQHRSFAMKPFLRCGIDESLAGTIADELVLKD